jgi:hypothetical protein
MTEDCFQKGALAFATATTTIRHTDGSAPEFTIPAMDVTEGVVPAGAPPWIAPHVWSCQGRPLEKIRVFQPSAP